MTSVEKRLAVSFEELPDSIVRRISGSRLYVVLMTTSSSSPRVAIVFPQFVHSTREPLLIVNALQQGETSPNSISTFFIKINV